MVATNSVLDTASTARSSVVDTRVASDPKAGESVRIGDAGGPNKAGKSLETVKQEIQAALGQKGAKAAHRFLVLGAGAFGADRLFLCEPFRNGAVDRQVSRGQCGFSVHENGSLSVC